MNRRHLLALPWLGAPSLMIPPAMADTPLQPLQRRSLDASLQAIADDASMPLASLAVAVARGGTLRHAAAFGFARMPAPGTDAPRPAGVPATPQTLYRVASVSKLVVAIGAWRLAEQGRLDLDADAGPLLGVPLRHPLAPDRPITPRLLLSHRSGLVDAAGYSFISTETALADLLRPGTALWQQGAAWHPRRPPGEWFQYCNLNYSLLGTLMEAASGERFDRLMQQLVLQPLRIEGGFHPAELDAAAWSRIATLYRKRDEAERWHPEGPWQPQRDDEPAPPPPPVDLAAYRPGRNATPFSPAGGLRISVLGLLRIGQMLLAEGTLDGVRVLQPASVRALRDPVWRRHATVPNGDDMGGAAQAWSAGAQVFTDSAAGGSGDRLVDGGGLAGFGHLGNAYGAYTALVIDPFHQAVVASIVGGVGRDPATQPGRYSSLYRFEERILSQLAAAL